MEELKEKKIEFTHTVDFEEACLWMSRGFVLAEISDWGSRNYPHTYSPVFLFQPYPNLEASIDNESRYQAVCRRYLFNQLKVKVPGVRVLRFKDKDGWYEVDARRATFSKKNLYRAA